MRAFDTGVAGGSLLYWLAACGRFGAFRAGRNAAAVRFDGTHIQVANFGCNRVNKL